MSESRLPESVDTSKSYTAAEFDALDRTCQLCGGRLTYDRKDVSDASSTIDRFLIGGYSCSGSC